MATPIYREWSRCNTPDEWGRGSWWGRTVRCLPYYSNRGFHYWTPMVGAGGGAGPQLGGGWSNPRRQPQIWGTRRWGGVGAMGGVPVRNLSGAAVETQWYGRASGLGGNPVKIGRPSVVPPKCAAIVPFPLPLLFQTPVGEPQWLVMTTKCQLPDEVNFLGRTPEQFAAQTAGFYRVIAIDGVGPSGVVVTDTDLQAGGECPFGRDRLDGAAAPGSYSCAQLFSQPNLASSQNHISDPQLARR